MESIKDTLVSVATVIGTLHFTFMPYVSQYVSLWTFILSLHPHSLRKNAVLELLLIDASLWIFVGPSVWRLQNTVLRGCCTDAEALKKGKLEAEGALHENIHTSYFIRHLRNDKLVCKNSISCSLTISPLVKSLFTLFQTPLETSPGCLTTHRQSFNSQEQVPFISERGFQRVVSQRTRSRQ